MRAERRGTMLAPIGHTSRRNTFANVAEDEMFVRGCVPADVYAEPRAMRRLAAA